MYDTILFVSLNTSDDEIGGILLNFSLSFAIVNEKFAIEEFFKCHKRGYILKDSGLVKETLGCFCLVLHEEDCQRIINNIGLLIFKGLSI